MVLGRWVVGLLFVALALPNTMRLLDRYEPALGIQPRPGETRLDLPVSWAPSPVWTVALAALAAVAIVRLSGPSEFLYWQF
jgi:hypothetical protein